MVKKLSLIILGLLLAGIAAAAVALGVIYGNTDSGATGNGSATGDATTGTVTPDNSGNSNNNANVNNGNANNSGNGGNNSGSSNNSGSNNGTNNGNSSNGGSQHTCAFVFDSTVAPDCVNGGYDLYKCSCGATDNRNLTNSLGHDHVWTVHNATCTTDWSQTGVCSRCGYTETQTVPNSKRHAYGTYTYNNDATCTADGTETATCSSCGVTDIRTVANSMLSHSYGAYVSNKDATCVADGTKTATCSRCGKKDTVTDTGTKGNGHKYGSWSMPSTGDCQTQSVSTRTCSVCGNTDTRTGGFGAHQVVNNKCTVCNKSASASNHIYIKPVNASNQGNFGTVYLDIYVFSVDEYNNMTFELFIGQEYTDTNGKLVKTYKQIVIEKTFDPKNIGPYTFDLWSINDNCYITFNGGMDYDCWPDKKEGRFWLGLDSAQGYDLNEFYDFKY